MRVLVLSDAIAGLTSSEAGAAIARAWADLGADVAVVGLGAADAGFAESAASLAGASPELMSVGEVPCTLTTLEPGVGLLTVPVPAGSGEVIDRDASSTLVGQALRQALEAAIWDELVVECVAPDLHDGGAGCLAWLGAVSDVDLTSGVDGLMGLTHVDLSEVREHLGRTRLVLVTSAEEATRHLTGLRGITSVKGHSVVGAVDPADLLAIDQTLVDFAAATGAQPQAPGSGACGGLGAVFGALGGSVTSGPEWLAERAGVQRTLAQADLLVVGCGPLDFGSMGGPVLTSVLALAAGALVPVVVVAETNRVSARELRTIGVESAHALRAEQASEDELTATDVTERCRSVARTWTW